MTAIGGVRTRVMKSAAAARSARILSQRRSSRVATPRGDRKATVSRRAQVLEEDVKYVEETTADMFSQVDEKKMLEEKAFPIKPEELIRLTKEFLSLNNGCDKPEILADDFTFAGPVVGPIPKDAFVKAFSSFQVGDAFPDMKANAYNFHVDPFDGNRVWFMSRAVGTHTGVLAGKIQPTGIKVFSPPQATSVTFNEKGQATHMTAGYVMDRAVGNTGGLGGVFGLMWAIGKSPFQFPEGRPWKPSWQYRFFMFISNFMQKFAKKKDD